MDNSVCTTVSKKVLIRGPLSILYICYLPIFRRTRFANTSNIRAGQIRKSPGTQGGDVLRYFTYRT